MSSFVRGQRSLPKDLETELAQNDCKVDVIWEKDFFMVLKIDLWLQAFQVRHKLVVERSERQIPPHNYKCKNV